jgi:hypothetical protein
VSRLRAGRQDNRFRLQARTEIYFLVQHSTDAPILVNRIVAALSSCAKQSRSEADHFILFSTQAKIVRNYTSIKTDSHIACCAHAVPLPCCASKGLDVSFAFDLHNAAVSDSHFPCRAHAMLWPCRSSQGHGTARPPRDGLWATCPPSTSFAYYAGFQKNCYQKHTNLPHNDPYLRL